jgi:hypothetical protein
MKPPQLLVDIDHNRGHCHSDIAELSNREGSC